MRSRLGTGLKPARLRGSPTEKATGKRAWHQRWLALDDERLRLVDIWCETFGRLERQPGWFALSADEMADAERNSGLLEIDKKLRVIEGRLRRWLSVMPTDPSHAVEDVAVSLQVAQRVLPIDENPLVHGLISRAVLDLARIQDAP